MLKSKIQEDSKKALKKKDEISSSALRMLLAAILNKEKEKRYKIAKTEPELIEEELIEKSQLTDEEVTEVMSSEVKKRKESILEFEKGERQNLAEKEKKELEVLNKYLPEQLSEEDIKKLAKEAIAALRASLAPSEREKVGLKNMGKVMQELMPQVKGEADGSLVSKIVKELLIPPKENNA